MKKVLIIDDDQLFSETWKVGLKSAGFDVLLARTGNDGISMTINHQPDLVLLDQVIPDMRGNQVLATLKQDQTTMTVPIILMSNFNEPEVMKEAMLIGAADYLLKYETEINHLITRINAIVM